MERIRLDGEDPEYMGFVMGAAITKAVYRALRRFGIDDIEDDVFNVISYVINADVPFGTLQSDIQDAVDTEINQTIEIGEVIVKNGIMCFNPDNEVADNV